MLRRSGQVLSLLFFLTCAPSRSLALSLNSRPFLHLSRLSRGRIQRVGTTTSQSPSPKNHGPIRTAASDLAVASEDAPKPKNRFLAALPGKTSEDDDLDKTILWTAIPAMINLAVVPVVNSVDTFWVGRMGSALALAGQAASNQAFFTVFFLVNYLPTITAPLVAKAVGSGDQEEAQKRICESIFLCNLLGGLGTLLLVTNPHLGLSLVLPKGAPALEYAVPYLRVRALSMTAALMSATGFAAYRGLLNTVTPLKVSLATNLFNLILDPILIFYSPLGFIGAAAATALAELLSGGTYLYLLLRRKLARWSLLLRPPPIKSLIPLLQGGISMLGRQIALNVGMVSAARCAQSMDPSGVTAAAYGITMQIYLVGIVVHVALQGTAAALVPATFAKSGEDDARRMADRAFVWSSIVGLLLGVTQYLALPWLVPVFSTLPAVQEAVRRPALLASLLHVINGPVFAGEGVMLGLGAYRDLMLVTAGGIATLVACLRSPLGLTLDGIWFSKIIFCSVQGLAVVLHYLKASKLAVKKEKAGP